MSAKRINAKVISKECLSLGIYSMWIACGSVAKEAIPGQFILLYCKDQTRKLGRPISICEIDDLKGELRVVYRVVGKGTEEFSKLQPGEEITMMGPLGNGYTQLQENAILVAGGIGIPPMLELAKQLPGKKTIILGYRDAQLFLKEEFEAYGDVIVATEDGSVGTRGNVLDAIKEHQAEGDVLYACGPKPMLRALSQYADEQHLNAWFSLEEKMACGIGICLGCAVPIRTPDGFTYKRVCKDGPVFQSKEIIFDE